MKSADSLTLPANDNYTPNALNQLTNVDGSMRTHDDDGNLLEDGTRLYVWDAENRLIEVKEKATSNVIAEYAYDYKSRRVEKTESGVTTSYLYEGWNPIAEYTGNVLTKSYTWGMDLSGSMQGAGGVGGLLAVNDGASSYCPTYDGNGNVSEYVDATGTVVAHYEYDAFGRTVAESGAKAADFSHRFSTKPKENFGEFYNYGYRFYDAGLGRWLNRDPIEERGGVNLYGFVGNDGVNSWDLLGMHCDDCAALQDQCWDAADTKRDNIVASANAIMENVLNEIDQWYKDYVNSTCDQEDALLREACKLGVEAAMGPGVFNLKATAVGTNLALRTQANMDKIRDYSACQQGYIRCKSTYGKDENGCPSK